MQNYRSKDGKVTLMATVSVAELAELDPTVLAEGFDEELRLDWIESFVEGIDTELVVKVINDSYDLAELTELLTKGLDKDEKKELIWLIATS